MQKIKKHRTRIKFCGITCAEDAQAAAQAGADAIGLVFYPPAVVAITPQEAVDIAQAVPPFVAVVALFVNADTALVNEVVQSVRPSLLQFHGDEDPNYCQSFNTPYIKACRVQTPDDIRQSIKSHRNARGVLLDAKVEGMYGGSGRTFDWTMIPDAATMPLIIAGGLTAATVGELIIAHRPWAVDASSGVATDSDKRRKEYDKMTAFVKQVKDADE
ncbi:MAG: phosphoribosylanthranilate isomerase [Gammaproteobacteria bacterium WSBS_2016_MAG_OTU1]